MPMHMDLINLYNFIIHFYYIQNTKDHAVPHVELALILHHNNYKDI